MPIPWGLAVVTAPFVPTLVFWTSVLLALVDGDLGSWLMPVISLLWLLLGVVLARTAHSELVGIGIGLATGAVPCFLWTTGTGLA